MHENKTKLTVGVCVKNGEDLIEDAIESILRQDFPHEFMEVIFVDDGSEDKTLSIIESYVPKIDMNLKVFHHEWKGLGYSRNLVVRNANGEYIIWVDADMILPKNFVRKQVEFMDRNPNVGIGKGIYGIHNAANLVSYLENLDAIVEFLNGKNKNHYKPLGTGGSIYRVGPVREVKGFDESIKGAGEDMDLEFRIKTCGWQLQVTTAEFYERRRRNWKDLWKEYFWHGSGGRMIFDKVSPHSMLFRMFPPISILIVISRSCNAYKLMRKKKVFLLPLHWIFKRIAWSLGFAFSV